MITSKMFRANHPSRVIILLSTPKGKQSGLLTDSVVMTDNLATIFEFDGVGMNPVVDFGQIPPDIPIKLLVLFVL